MKKRKRRVTKRNRRDIKEIQKGPIIHSELPPDQVENLRWIWEHIKDVEPARSFEEFELDFCRDRRPEREIAIWLKLTVAMLEFQSRNQDKHSKHSVFSELIGMTVGANASNQFTKSESSSLRTLFQTADQYVKNWAEEPRSSVIDGEERKLLIAPVAEYRGIALCEIKGDKRAVWKGVEYQTDGNIWLIAKGVTEDGFAQMVGIRNERQAKTTIDGMSPVERSGFRSLVEVNELLGCNECEMRQHAERVVNGFHWRFDNEQGVFIPQDKERRR